jgi:pimeloyl-ACP methyl ester carboxylesterase
MLRPLPPTPDAPGPVELDIEPGRRAALQMTRHRLEAEVPLVLTRTALRGGARLPPVLLVHGFAQNRYTWHTSIRSLSAALAAAGFEAWNLELRGHGLSRGEGQEGATVFADYIADLHAAIDALPDRPFLIGHSLGGAAAYAAAALRPGRVRGVIGLAAVYGFGNGNPLIRFACRVSQRAASAPALSRVQVKSRLLGQIIGRALDLTDIAGYTLPLSGWWPGSVEPALLQERLEEGFDWTSVKVWQEMARWGAQGAFDHDREWRAAEVPVLVVLGDKDHLLPVEDGRLAFDRARGPDKELLLLDPWTTGHHWGHLDIVLGKAAPAEVWPRLIAWMEARAGAAG